MAAKPHFISLEGGEGSGKTTQIKLMKEWFESKNIPVVSTREPGATPGGEALRALLVQGAQDRWDGYTDVLLYMAARRDNLTKIIWPSLENGTWVLCDRFTDSTLAYQCFGRGVPRKGIEDVYRFIAGDFKPHLTFFLDIDPRKGLERTLSGKGRAATAHENRFESFDFSFHETLHKAYKTLAAEEPERIVTINADQTLEQVQSDLRAAIEKRFGI